MENFNYKNIKILYNGIDYEFQGYHEGEVINGYSHSIDKAKSIIDENINYIEEYLERDQEPVYFSSFREKSRKTDFSEYEY